MTTDEQLMFDAPPDDPATAYLACGLTSLNDDQTTVVELVSGLVSEFCSKATVRVHQPVLHTHPRDHQDLTPAQVPAVDYGAVLESDVLIGIGDYASWGADKELAWAERVLAALQQRRLREGHRYTPKGGVDVPFAGPVGTREAAAVAERLLPGAPVNGQVPRRGSNSLAGW